MDSSHGPIADSTTLIEQTGIPRKVLSRLLSSTKIGVGFRVLDVGCGRGELAAYLDSLGIRCTGMDESPVNVIEAQRAVPTCEFNCASIGDPASGPKGGFDLVLVRQASVLSDVAVVPSDVLRQLAVIGPRPSGRLFSLSGTNRRGHVDRRGPSVRVLCAACRLFAGQRRSSRIAGPPDFREVLPLAGRGTKRLWLRSRRAAIAATAFEPGRMETGGRRCRACRGGDVLSMGGAVVRVNPLPL